MKELVAFLFLIVLIAAGWNQPYQEHYRSIFGDSLRKPAVNPLPSPSARQNVWDWQSGTLDQKAHR